MKKIKFLHVFLCSSLLVFLITSLAHAGESEIETLRKEIRELNNTVKNLSTTVENQNKRIDELESHPSRNKKEPEAPKVVQKKVEPKSLESKPEDLAPSPSSGSSSDQPSRSIGAWKYPVRSGAAWKLLPDISVIGIFSGAYFTQDPGPNGDNPQRTGFNLQEIELAFQSIIDPYVRGDVFLSFHEDGVDLEEGYVTSLGLPKGLQLRGGKYKVAFGRQNQKHTEVWPFVDNNLINTKIFGAEGFNDLGTELSYLFPTPFFLQFQASVNNGTNEGNFNGPEKGDLAYTGRLSGSADISKNVTTLIGASAAFGFNDTGPDQLTSIIGGDFLLKWRPAPERGIDWQSEYIYRHRQIPGGTESDGGISSYLLGNWSKRWGAGLRAEYYGIPNIGERTFSLSPMISFRTTEFFRLRAQYELLKTFDGNTNHAAFLQMIFNMGPHGAHQF
jgi:hypothetical protein